jgi:hypothetical protein
MFIPHYAASTPPAPTLSTFPYLQCLLYQSHQEKRLPDGHTRTSFARCTAGTPLTRPCLDDLSRLSYLGGGERSRENVFSSLLVDTARFILTISQQSQVTTQRILQFGLVEAIRALNACFRPSSGSEYFEDSQEFLPGVK